MEAGESSPESKCSHGTSQKGDGSTQDGLGEGDADLYGTENLRGDSNNDPDRRPAVDTV